ncbi:hypothetical protein JTB14_026352 [Gonioctena quinquepunctata]|nr:hypothetical protein JTB14_026352 [Gonioctena quinquepunctata]
MTNLHMILVIRDRPPETALDVDESNTAVTISEGSSYEILLDPSTGQIIHVPEEDGRKRKRKPKGQGDPSNWKRKQNFTKRLRGESHYGFQKYELGKYRQTALKPVEVLKPACKSNSRVGRGGPQQNFLHR